MQNRGVFKLTNGAEILSKSASQMAPGAVSVNRCIYPIIDGFRMVPKSPLCKQEMMGHHCFCDAICFHYNYAVSVRVFIALIGYMNI